MKEWSLDRSNRITLPAVDHDSVPDPTSSSVLAPVEVVDSGEIADADRPYSKIYNDPKTGKKFVAIAYENLKGDNNYPFGQWAISQMLKGVIPVADIVPMRVSSDVDSGATTILGSRMMPLAHIKEKMTNDHKDAYLFVLRQLFERQNDPHSAEHHIEDQRNVAYDKELGVFVFYDFAGSVQNFFDDHFLYYFPTDLGHNKVIEPLLLSLKSQFEGERGERFLEAILNRVRAMKPPPASFFPQRDITKVTAPNIQRILLVQIEDCLTALSKLNKSQS